MESNNFPLDCKLAGRKVHDVFLILTAEVPSEASY